jgi:hypothetical protein
VADRSHPLFPLYSAGQDVISQIRLVGQPGG